MSRTRMVRVADVAARGTNSLATGPFGSSISARFFRMSGVPVIRGGNLSADSAIRLSDENLVFLDPDKASEFRRSTVHAGDLVFTSWGTINQVGLVDSSAAYDEYVISNKQMKLTPDPDVASSEFLYYLFSSPAMQREILEGSIGSSIPGFNLTRLRSMEIELPPIEEQRQIAAVISQSERLEVGLRTLLAKKQLVKQGMMQQLLTGRTRIPGFSRPWLDKRIADVASITKGTQLGRTAMESGQTIPVWNGGIEPSGFTNNANVRRAVVTVSEGGNSCGWVGRPEGPFWLGGHCYALDPKARGHSVAFLYHRLKLAESQIMALRVGSGLPNIQKKRLSDFVVSVPSDKDEATAIAQALDDADHELATVRLRLTKAQQIKTGMMQQLLTGRARQPVEAAS